MRNVYKSFRSECIRESGVTPELIQEFSDSEDLEHLPDDHSLKCYIYCQYRNMEMMDTEHPVIQMDILLENIGPGVMKPEHSQFFLNMGKKCFRIKTKTTDLCEVAYLFNVCLKKGDIDVSLMSLFYYNIETY